MGMRVGVHAALQHDTLFTRVLQSGMSDEMRDGMGWTRRIRLS
jgi:hypothetical protein